MSLTSIEHIVLVAQHEPQEGRQVGIPVAEGVASVQVSIHDALQVAPGRRLMIHQETTISPPVFESNTRNPLARKACKNASMDVTAALLYI